MVYDFLNNADFAYPYMFGLFALVPLLIYWYMKKGNKVQAAIPVSTTHAFTASSLKTRLRHAPFVLRLLAISCLIVALARPQKRNDEQRTEGEGIDIVLCMDVSGSMGSRDIQPSRMEVAKEMAIEFVQSRPVDRIGLVIFSGESFTQCPITTDKRTLIDQIQSLESRRYLKDGTVIGEGLATAVDRLTKSTAKSKVIILITDGKEDAPDTRLIDPITALEIAKAHGIKVYTIGMGAMATNITEVQENPGTPPRKNPAIDFIDEDLLRRIAEETGGRYFRARDKEGLKNTYSQIDKMEKSKVEVQSFKRFKELFFPFMLAAIAFLFLEMILRLTILKRFP
jgi:Ca-activated chloride channel homolog